MKILYVEDELLKNISNILILFDLFLSDIEKKELMDIQNDNGFQENDNVKRVFDKNDFIDVYYHFPTVCNILFKQQNQYGLYIIDRNLREVSYSINDFEKLSVEYTEKLFEKYYEREGDFLLQYIKEIDSNWSNKFYFLTANPNKSIDVLEDDIERKKFRKENIIEKSNNEQWSFLCDVVSDFEANNIRVKYKDIFELFRQNILPDECKDLFIDIAKNIGENKKINIKVQLGNIRKVLEYICRKYAEIQANNDNILYDKFFQKEKLITSKVINYLSKKYNNNDLKIIVSSLRNIKIESETFSLDELDSLNLKNADKALHIKFISLRLEELYALTCQFGAHVTDSGFFHPTTYTLKTSFYSLCDILLWLKSIIEEN